MTNLVSHALIAPLKVVKVVIARPTCSTVVAWNNVLTPIKIWFLITPAFYAMKVALNVMAVRHQIALNVQNIQLF